MLEAEEKMFDFAYTLTQSAGAKLKFERKHSEMEVSEKTSSMDLVTKHDVMIEKYIVEAIHCVYPEHSILSEESHTITDFEDGKYTWVIDPIDGTVNYYRFGKDYAISVALYFEKEPIFGLVYDVEKNIMHQGMQGEGENCHCCRPESDKSDEIELNQAIVGMSIRTMKELSSLGSDVFKLLSKSQGHRYIGCASLELCKIASGEYDLFISSNVYPWDFAAARVMIEKSGGNIVCCDNKKTSDKKMFVAAYRSPKLWEEVQRYLPETVKHQLIGINF